MEAGEVFAVDNDEWALRNTEKNAEYNRAKMHIILGDVDAVQEEHFDIILANINRNILLRHLPYYGKMVKPRGEIIISGFYYADLDILQKQAKENHLIMVDYMEKRNWIAALFKKQ
jgi:ribosomal protein L11 methyltransferase